MREVKVMYEGGKKEYTYMCTEDIKKGDKVVVHGTNNDYRNPAEKELKILNVIEDSVEYTQTKHLYRRFIIAHIDLAAYKIKQDELTELIRTKAEEQLRAADKERLLKEMQRHVANHVAMKIIEDTAKEDPQLASMLEQYRRL